MGHPESQKQSQKRRQLRPPEGKAAATKATAPIVRHQAISSSEDSRVCMSRRREGARAPTEGLTPGKRGELHEKNRRQLRSPETGCGKITSCHCEGRVLPRSLLVSIGHSANSRSLAASRARTHRGNGKSARDFARDDSARFFSAACESKTAATKASSHVRHRAISSIRPKGPTLTKRGWGTRNVKSKVKSEGNCARLKARRPLQRQLRRSSGIRRFPRAKIRGCA